MYVHQKTEPQLWTVGHYDSNGTWYPDSDHSNSEEAARRARFLNGGEQSLPDSTDADRLITEIQALRLDFKALRLDINGLRAAIGPIDKELVNRYIAFTLGEGPDVPRYRLMSPDGDLIGENQAPYALHRFAETLQAGGYSILFGPENSAEEWGRLEITATGWKIRGFNGYEADFVMISDSSNR